MTLGSSQSRTEKTCYFDTEPESGQHTYAEASIRKTVLRLTTETKRHPGSKSTEFDNEYT
jgi:hypothetical protein